MAVDEGIHTGYVNRVSLFVVLVWQLMNAYTLAMFNNRFSLFVALVWQLMKAYTLAMLTELVYL